VSGRKAGRTWEERRKLMTIDMQDLADVRDRMTQEAEARQYRHTEPFLRRVLVLLFRDGHLDKLPI
jgi:hypothetical protein